MTNEAVTILIVSLVAAGLIAWDIYVAFFNEEKGDTISEVLRHAGQRMAGVPFAWGALGGHFWGWQQELLLPQPWSGVLLGATATLLAVAHFIIRKLTAPPAWSATFYLVVGIPFGAVLWPL